MENRTERDWIGNEPGRDKWLVAAQDYPYLQRHERNVQAGHTLVEKTRDNRLAAGGGCLRLVFPGHPL
jgi:hypothetical protein